MRIESKLRDEIEELKDKGAKLIQAENTLEVYKAKLEEIPGLKS